MLNFPVAYRRAPPCELRASLRQRGRNFCSLVFRGFSKPIVSAFVSPQCDSGRAESPTLPKPLFRTRSTSLRAGSTAFLPGCAVGLSLLTTTTHLINAFGDATRAKALYIGACNAGLKARSSTNCAKAHL